jgi:hypothetical protein
MKTHLRDISKKKDEEPIKYKYKEGAISYYLTRVLFSPPVFYSIFKTDV